MFLFFQPFTWRCRLVGTNRGNVCHFFRFSTVDALQSFQQCRCGIDSIEISLSICEVAYALIITFSTKLAKSEKTFDLLLFFFAANQTTVCFGAAEFESVQQQSARSGLEILVALLWNFSRVHLLFTYCWISRIFVTGWKVLLLQKDGEYWVVSCAFTIPRWSNIFMGGTRR